MLQTRLCLLKVMLTDSSDRLAQCAMVMNSLQFNDMSRLKTVSFSCELNTPKDNGSTANNLKLVIDYCADNGRQEARPKYDDDAVCLFSLSCLIKDQKS